MKQGWEIKKLVEVCKIGDGNHSSKYPKSAEMTPSGIPFIRANNMVNGKVCWDDMKFITNEKHSILKKGHLRAGDILFTNRGEIGKIAIVGSEFDNSNLNSQIAWLRCFEILNNKFLYYLLLSPLMSNHFLIEKNGAALQQFTIKQINELLIPIPPLPEQERIVSILDQVFSAIEQAKANAEKNLKNAKELFDSYLTSVFTNKGHAWEEKTLGEVCVVERGSSPRPIDNFLTNSEDGVNWIKIGDTKGIDKYLYKTKEKITKEGAQKSRFVKEGDFILSNSMSFGKPYIMKTKGYIHDGWFVLRLPSNIHPEFFWYLLASPYTMSQFIGLASGAIVKNISGDLVKKTKLPIPPFEEQKEIAQKLDALSAETKQLEVIYQLKLTELEDLKKSILQKAFNGELI